MACNITLVNTIIQCEDPSVSAGVKAMYLIQSDDVVSFTASVAQEHSYTGITLASTGDKFVKVEIKNETGTNGYVPEEGGNGVAYTLNAEGFIPHQEKVKSYSLQQHINAGYHVAIIAYTNGEAFVYGYDEKLLGDAQLLVRPTGVNEAEFTGLNGYTFSLSGKQIEMPRQFIGTIPTDDGAGGITPLIFS